MRYKIKIITWIIVGFMIGQTATFNLMRYSPAEDAIHAVVKEFRLYYKKHNQLPNDLDFLSRDLKREITQFNINYDPEKKTLRSFQTCYNYENSFLYLLSCGLLDNRGFHGSPGFDLTYIERWKKYPIHNKSIQRMRKHASLICEVSII